MINGYKEDGAPCAVKVARTVWRRGKGRDNIKALPIPIEVRQQSQNEHAKHDHQGQSLIDVKKP